MEIWPELKPTYPDLDFITGLKQLMISKIELVIYQNLLQNWSNEKQKAYPSIFHKTYLHDAGNLVKE